MSNLSKSLAEILMFLLVLTAFMMLAEWRNDRSSIPREPPEQLDEATVDGWGEPRSSEWSAVRAAHVKRHPACLACGSVEQLNVHHIEPFHLRPDLELEPSNLVTLCREHHFRIGHDPDGPWKPQKPSWIKSNPNVRQDAINWARSSK
jgi:5-methylcytosine-specific restriction endonuclease McrA